MKTKLSSFIRADVYQLPVMGHALFWDFLKKLSALMNEWKSDFSDVQDIKNSLKNFEETFCKPKGRKRKNGNQELELKPKLKSIDVTSIDDGMITFKTSASPSFMLKIPHTLASILLNRTDYTFTTPFLASSLLAGSISTIHSHFRQRESLLIL
jgi:hypothetical protein